MGDSWRFPTPHWGPRADHDRGRSVAAQVYGSSLEAMTASRNIARFATTPRTSHGAYHGE